jgi:hypothetical protein
MQLEPVGDMSIFDWRAELGDASLTLKEPQSEAGETFQPATNRAGDKTMIQGRQQAPLPPEANDVLEIARAQTVLQDSPSSAIDPALQAPLEPGNPDPAAATMHTGKARKIGLLLLCLAALLAGATFLNKWLGAKPEDQSNAKPVTASSAPVLTPASAAPPPVAPPAFATTSLPVATLVSSPASVPAPLPAASRRTRASVVTPAKAASVQAPSAQVAPAQAASSAVKQVQTAPAKIDPAQNEPAVLCADSNFLTRPMCIYQECQKPQLAHLAVCVENRKQYPAKNRQSYDQ